jgi:LTXXQ motif family protein
MSGETPCKPSRRSSRKIALALLTGVTVAATGVSSSALAGRGGGGGGGHGGGGGGGGFHSGGGGGFYGGGGGFTGRVGGGSFHGYTARGVSPSFAGHTYAGHAYASRVVASHFYTPHPNAGRYAISRGVATAHYGLATHAPINAANRLRPQGQFALSHVAAQNFRGLNNFNRAGFNRNAFGNRQAWNHWGGRFWGAGWHRWGWGWGGWAGPVFWPYLYGDIFSFCLWPYDYFDPFWAFGPDFVLASIFAPGPSGGPDYGYGPDSGYTTGNPPSVYYGTTRAENKTITETEAAAAESCSGLAPGVTNLPIAEIRSTVKPTPDQATALDELNAESTKANTIVNAACPTAVPLTPVARLDTAESRLEAVVEAVQVMRGPLEKFYDSLNDEQKHRFDTMGNNPTRGSASPGGDVAALCSQQSSDVTKLPVQRIEQVVQPNAQQQEAFDALKEASEDSAGQLQGSCPAQMPQTPVARLDAVRTRLNAMVEAMKTVRPKLADFYASLSDEQKARFNTMGPPQNAPAPHQSSDQ